MKNKRVIFAHSINFTGPLVALAFGFPATGIAFCKIVFLKLTHSPIQSFVGANGLANPRDFLTPVAAYEDTTPTDGFQVVSKYQGHVFQCSQVSVTCIKFQLNTQNQKIAMVVGHKPLRKKPLDTPPPPKCVLSKFFCEKRGSQLPLTLLKISLIYGKKRKF